MITQHTRQTGSQHRHQQDHPGGGPGGVHAMPSYWDARLRVAHTALAAHDLFGEISQGEEEGGRPLVLRVRLSDRVDVVIWCAFRPEDAQRSWYFGRLAAARGHALPEGLPAETWPLANASFVGELLTRVRGLAAAVYAATEAEALEGAAEGKRQPPRDA